MSALPTGVGGDDRLTLNAGQIKFLASLRRAVPASVPIYVTSATRTPEQQAAALVTKRNLGDNLYALYRRDDIVKELMAVPNTTAAMAAVIRKWMGRNVYLSRHMRGDALDIRSKDIQPAQIQAIMAAARGLASKAILESTPPHIHVESIGGTLSDFTLAAQEGAASIANAGQSAKERARRAAIRRATALYKRRRLLYAVGAAGLAVLVIATTAIVTRKKERVQ